jgi:tol-pal system protein YbgF
MLDLRGIDFVKGCALVLWLCLLAACVTKTEFQPYQNRVRDLEVETGQLEKQMPEVLESLESVRGDQADIKADMIDIRSDIQQLRGELSSGLHDREVAGKARESVEASVALQLNHLQQQMQAAEARLARIEDYFGLKPPEDAQVGKKPSAQGAAQPSKQVSTPTAAAGGGQETAVLVAPVAAPRKELSAEEAYEMAYHLFQSKENEAARKAFDQFMLRYPDSSLVDNALFWIGETYYRMEDYENAVLHYQQVVKQYPKGSKGPDALLKMGYSLEKMNEATAAVAAMEKLLKMYPKSPQAKLATLKIKQLKSDE